MSNKENKPQLKVAKVPCTKLILNRHQSLVMPIKQTAKPSGVTQGTAVTVHTQKPVLVHIHTVLN
jgi:hypothetical protein